MRISRNPVFLCVILTSLALATQHKPSTPQKPSEKDDRQFSIMQGEMDGHPLFAMIASDLKKYPAKARLPWFLGLSTPLVNPTEDGLPQDKDFDGLNDWEDEIEARIAKLGKYYYVGHVTWNGSREELFYIEKPEPIVSELKKVRDRHITRPFDFRFEKDEGWSKISPYIQPIGHPSSQ